MVKKSPRKMRHSGASLPGVEKDGRYAPGYGETMRLILLSFLLRWMFVI